MTKELAALSATETSRHFASGELSPVEATQAVVDNIDALNPYINAFCWLDPDGALAAAKDSETRWQRGKPLSPLDGVTFTVKDLSVTKGWPTRRGSRAIGPEGPWLEDSPSVARMREAGAVPLGKTTVPEFGATGTTRSELCGVTRNPWDLSKSPGGSSGGSSAAAAANMGAIALASDAAGSIRWPAAFTGTFGLKTTHGRVPDYPSSYLGTLAVIGPITRTVADTALCMDVIAQDDPRDSYALPPPPSYADTAGATDLSGMRILFSPDLGFVDVDPEIDDMVRRAVDELRELGATVDETGHVMNDPGKILSTLMTPGLANAFRLFGFTEADEAMMHPVLLEYVKAGRETPLLDYLHAREKREQLGAQMREIYRDYDLLVTPTTPLPTHGAEEESSSDPRYRNLPNPLVLTSPFNLTKQPAASLPIGLNADGLPVGMQVVGPLYGEADILRMCRAYEAAHPFARPDLDALLRSPPEQPVPRGIASMQEAVSAVAAE
ncbi:MAG: amidase [Alphaproteobacteria bacterium]|nr:amidase [Alphaproteobacteria bacterium]